VPKEASKPVLVMAPSALDFGLSHRARWTSTGRLNVAEIPGGSVELA
jgi:hypothetical protein